MKGQLKLMGIAALFAAVAMQAFGGDCLDELDEICTMAAEGKPEAKAGLCRYIKCRQRPDGLFRRGEKDDVASGAVNGRVAVAFVGVLRKLSHYDSEYKPLSASARLFSEALEGVRKSTGLWGESLDDPKSKDDPEASARIATFYAYGATGRPTSIQWWYLDFGYLDLAAEVQTILAKDPAFAKSAAKRELDLAIAASNAADKPPKYLRKMTLSQRAAAGEVVKPGELRVEATYVCISVAWGAPRKFEKGVTLKYRKAGEKSWSPALEPLFYAPNRNYRGSIVNLEEGTDYEVVLEAEGREMIRGKTRTWSTKVPIAKTVEIDPAAVRFPIEITEKGTPEAWIRYVPKGGEKLVNGEYAPTFVIRGAAYVILDGFTIVGGKSDGSITITDGARDIRILNCEISGWGPGGPPLWGTYGKGCCYEGKTCVQNGAICLGRWPCNITIERCFIHSPRGRANSWRYSHPYGPEAVQADNPYSPVIRWCDFVGSDSRRFEDHVKSLRNGGYNTGLNYNADVYGCFMFGANDDCIELDGGQQNVRCFRNRFEEALMGVSIQCCNTSPSYVFENAFTGLGTEFGHVGSEVKTSSVDSLGQGAVSYVLHNTFASPERSSTAALDLTIDEKTARVQAFNNLFADGQQFAAPKGAYQGRFADNVVDSSADALVASPRANVSPTHPKNVPALANFSRLTKDGQAVAGARLKPEKGAFLPERPIPWALDAGRFDIVVKGGKASRTSDTFRLDCAGKGFRRAFRVRTTEQDTDWFDVSPKEGFVESGKQIVFTITYDASKLNARRRYAAAFLVRTDDGFSRPVSLHVETDYVSPFRNPNPRDVVVYGKKAEKTGGGGEEWTFDVPDTGRYYIHVRASNPKTSGMDFTPPENKIEFAFDGEKLGGRRYQGVAFPQLKAWPTWAPLNPGGHYDAFPLELKKGTHVLRMDSCAPDVILEGFAVLQDPVDLEGEKRE